MELPEKIAGLDIERVREMFKNFTVQKTEIEWNDAHPVVKVRRMNPDFIAGQLVTSSGEAQRIQAALVAEGWIEADKFTPTRKGMALSQHVDRPKLPRAVAEALLTKVLDWADRINAVADARVKVKTIHLYGSMLQAADEVGDVDLFIEFTTMDLDVDLQCEDMDRENELSEELASISDYLSPSSWIDRELMNDVPMRQEFPRGG
jgi:predicted nucleotidyltransferase